MLRPGRWRYLRTAKVMLQFPTYARLVWGLARDARTPVGLKLLLGAALTYVVTPVDLIPDVVPILGHADDLTVLLLVLDLFISNAPARFARSTWPERGPERASWTRTWPSYGSCSGIGSTGSATTCRSCSSGSARWGTRRGQAPDRRMAWREQAATREVRPSGRQGGE